MIESKGKEFFSYSFQKDLERVLEMLVLVVLHSYYCLVHPYLSISGVDLRHH